MIPTQYDEHDDEVMGMAKHAIAEAGVAFPEDAKVRNDLLLMFDCLRSDYRNHPNTLSNQRDAYTFGKAWVDAEMYYMDAVRWADLALWRFDILPLDKPDLIYAQNVMGFMQCIVARAYGEMAIHAWDFLQEAEV